MNNDIIKENREYYIPKLEEFHTGFEYEIYIPEKEEWGKETFYLNKSHIDLVRYVDIQDQHSTYFIRVKYLNKKDIESLGWRWHADKISPYGESMYTIYKEEGFNSGTEYTLFHLGTSTRIQIFEHGSYGDTLDGFKVNIKNKSELKKLMQQLSI